MLKMKYASKVKGHDNARLPNPCRGRFMPKKFVFNLQIFTLMPNP